MKKETAPVSRIALIPLTFLTIILALAPATAQTTVFTYQGQFTDLTQSQQPTSGAYNMRFALFGSLAGSDQIGAAVTLSNVQVSSGVFTVQLNFTVANAFDGAARYLEISVFNPATGAYVTLTPRQPITSSPYAIRTIRATVATNAENLGGVPAANFVQTNDARLTDARTPTAGSPDYVQNGTAAQNASFNVAGSGTVGGTLAAGKLTVTGGVLARGGGPGAFGANNNGYAFSGNGGDNDSGLFSTGNGQVSLYTNNTERVRVDDGGLTVTGTISGTLAGDTVTSEQVADASLRLVDMSTVVSTANLPQTTIFAHTCATYSMNISGLNVAANDILSVYFSNSSPAGLYIQPSIITNPASVAFSICNTLNSNSTIAAQSLRVVVQRP